mgnify:CR=1 FL=1
MPWRPDFITSYWKDPDWVPLSGYPTDPPDMVNIDDLGPAAGRGALIVAARARTASAILNIFNLRSIRMGFISPRICSGS